MNEAKGTAPLSGLRVLDLTRIMAGPWATQTLSDLGAEVVKIERPLVGDDTRTWGPPFLRDRKGVETAESAYNLAVNRGKKSVTVDISTKQGQLIIRSFAAVSDVLIENFKVDELKGFGLGFDDLRKVNPKLIYCSITGFGQTGPYRKRRGYDFALQAMGGLMSVTGEADGRPGAGPEKVGVAVADIMAGMYAVIGILSALRTAERTGCGEHIDISLLDAQVAMMANQNLNYLTTGVAPTRLGNAHPNIAPYQCFQTGDGHVVLTVGNDAQFKRFCEAIARPDLIEEERFSTNPSRVKNRDALISILSKLMSERTSKEWLELLSRYEVPCGPVNTIKEVFEDEQVVHRGLESTRQHPLGGAIKNVACPIVFSEAKLSYDVVAPLLGQHTDEVLRADLGYDSEYITELRKKGVV